MCLTLGEYNGIGQYWGGANIHSRISAGCGTKIFVGVIVYTIALFQLWINKGQGHNLLLSGGEILRGWGLGRHLNYRLSHAWKLAR